MELTPIRLIAAPKFSITAIRAAEFRVNRICPNRADIREARARITSKLNHAMQAGATVNDATAAAGRLYENRQACDVRDPCARCYRSLEIFRQEAMWVESV